MILLQLIVWATVGVCAVEAFCKIWLSLLLVPIALVVLPVFIILEYLATFSRKDAYRGAITLLQVMLAVAMLAYFAAALGFGDDPSTEFVLGIYWVPTDSLLAHDLATLSTLGMYVAVGAAIVLIGLVVARYTRKLGP